MIDFIHSSSFDLLFNRLVRLIDVRRNKSILNFETGREITKNQATANMILLPMKEKKERKERERQTVSKAEYCTVDYR